MWAESTTPLVWPSLIKLSLEMSRAVTELQDTSAACEIERGQKSTGVLRKAPQRRLFQNLTCSKNTPQKCFWEPSLTQALTLHCSPLHLTPQWLQLQTPCSHSTSACWGGGSPNTAQPPLSSCTACGAPCKLWGPRVTVTSPSLQTFYARKGLQACSGS